MATVSSIDGSALLDDVVVSYAYLPLESYRLYSGVDYFIETYADHFDFFPLGISFYVFQTTEICSSYYEAFIYYPLCYCSSVRCCLALLRFNAVATDQTDIRIMLGCGLRLFDLLSRDVILLLLFESNSKFRLLLFLRF